MRKWEVMAAVTAAIICLAILVGWAIRRHPCRREYKNVYEQMHMERMIT